MDKSFLNGGDFNKFFVFKTTDIEKCLTDSQKESLKDISETISLDRIFNGKNGGNKYLVINIDEPYAPEIVEILKRNGHWG